MHDSLLATKLYVPLPRAGAVSRQRLLAKVCSGVDRPRTITLLSGPAGSGKTTLLSEFAARLGRPVSWLTLDVADDDPARFWAYLIAACQTTAPGVGEAALALLRTPQAAPTEVVPTILINELAQRDDILVLVLDDLQEIQSQSIHAGLTFLLDHLPPNLRLVISTRTDPPWPLARYRARNQLVQIRARDLRFSPEEAGDLLNRTMELGLSASDVAALQARTEGWAAGLQLAALSLQGRDDAPAFIRAFAGSHVYVAEYLLEEVLQRQPEDAREFLLATSILDRLHGDLCDAVTGRADSREVLAALHCANALIVPLDDEGRWFRYHHLFADLLRAHLAQALPPGEVAALHRRAAAWHEQRDHPIQAIDHALAAGDLDDAARLVEQDAYQLLTRGELSTLLRWIDQLPQDVVERHPALLVTQAWTLALAGAVGQVEPLLQQVEASVAAGDDTPAARELLGNVAAIRAFFAMMAAAYPAALQLAGRAESLLSAHRAHVQWLLPYIRGAAHRGQGHYTAAAEAFAQSAHASQVHGDLIGWATGVTEVALVLRLQGRLHEAAATCRQALEWMAQRGAARFGSLAKLEVPLIEVLREWNELDEAHRRAVDVIARMQAWPMPTDRMFAHLALLRIQSAQGDLDGARDTLRAAQALKSAYPVLMNVARAVDLAEIHLTLAANAVSEAARLVDALQPGTGRTAELRELELLALARLRLAQGQAPEAASVLAPLAAGARAGERIAAAIQILVLQAIAVDAGGDRQAATGILGQALYLAAPERFVRVFLDEGRAIRPLLAAAAHRLAAAPDPAGAAQHAYAASLLDACGAGPPPAGPPALNAAEPHLIEPLSPREREVLHLIAAGHSNRDIAARLVITVSAVKKHNSNIYGKLGVNSRTQAIARARDLGLLSEGE